MHYKTVLPKTNSVQNCKISQFSHAQNSKRRIRRDGLKGKKDCFHQITPNVLFSIIKFMFLEETMVSTLNVSPLIILNCKLEGKNIFPVLDMLSHMEEFSTGGRLQASQLLDWTKTGHKKWPLGHEKMLNTAIIREIQINYNELRSHTGQNGYD